MSFVLALTRLFNFVTVKSWRQGKCKEQCQSNASPHFKVNPEFKCLCSPNKFVHYSHCDEENAEPPGYNVPTSIGHRPCSSHNNFKKWFAKHQTGEEDASK